MNTITSSLKPLFFGLYLIFIIFSIKLDFSPGKKIAENFGFYLKTMLSVFPCTIIIISLFDEWVKSEKIEEYLGINSGFKGYLWAVILASFSAGNIYMTLPIAWVFYEKKAKIEVVLTYIGAASICKIPMAIFEASFLGIKFTVIRFIISLPLIVIASSLLGKYITSKELCPEPKKINSPPINK